MFYFKKTLHDATAEFKTPKSGDFGFFFNGDRVLTAKDGKVYLFPLIDVCADLKEIKEANSLFIGRWKNENVFAVEINRSFLEKNHSFQLIHGRDVLKLMDAESAYVFCRAKKLLFWHLSSLYCGSCGYLTKFSCNETAKSCERCNRLIYPSDFVAVIVLIVKDKHILLARSPHFPAGMYSTIAGFLDAGESIENTIHREIEEELGIRVKDISYFGSQCWPFPNSLMIGFKVKYDSGEIHVDKKEIEDARWYSKSDLPLLPSKSSIARHLIDSYLNE